MSIPFFLDSTQIPYNYLETVPLTDVESGGVGIITSFRAQCTGLSTPWTEPSTALFKTPVDAAGRFMDVLLTRISSTVIEWRVRNQSAATICTRRAQILSGYAVRMYVNIYGVFIDCLVLDPASSETLQAHILDQTPDLQTDSSNYVIGAGRRSGTSTDDGTGNTCGHYFALDNGVATHVAGRFQSAGDSAGTIRNYINPQGSMLFRDCQVLINQGGTNKWSGRICHALVYDSSYIAPHSDRVIKIDTSTTGTFRMTGQPLIQTILKMCMRKS